MSDREKAVSVEKASDLGAQERLLGEWGIAALLILFTIFAVAPYFHPGYFWGAHDARHDVYFILEYDQGVRQGNWLVRWCPDFAFGQGYPFFIVYGPLATFIGELFHHFLNFSLTWSVKSVFVIAVIGAALSMYLFVKSWAGKTAGFLAALVYVYIPYHLLDMFVRAALAETLSFLFLPLVLWAMRENVVRPRWKSIVIGAFAYGGLMITSNLVSLLFTPILVLYILMVILIQANREMPFRDMSGESAFPFVGELLHLAAAPAISLLLGLGLSAFFWIPAITEFKYVSTKQWYGGYYDFHHSFTYWHQLFSPHWGFGISEPGPDDDLSFQLGIVPLLLLSFAIYGWSKLKGEKKWHVGFFLAVSIVAAYLTLGASAWAWDHVPGVRFAQFPWRYLILTTLAVPPTAAALTEWMGQSQKRRWALTLFMAGIVIVASAPYLHVEIVKPPKGSGTLEGLMRFESTADEMTGVSYVAKKVPKWSPLAEVYVLGKKVTTKVIYSDIPPAGRTGPALGVHSLEMGTNYEKVWYWAKDDYQRINFFFEYFPGWTAYILDPKTGEVQKVIRLTEKNAMDPYGRMSVPVIKGAHILLLKFERTPIRKTADTISLATLGFIAASAVVALVLSLGNRRKKATGNG